MIETVVWYGFHTYAPKPYVGCVTFHSHLAPVHKYLIRSIKAINSNTETVKSYHCCLLPVACCLPSQV
ncbi:MAG: hypothetical protein F6K31_41940, partial [Symploca sp. SIO2G7]|nr:hypothetical protein [Symploca sp. SIO2G7]